jgi:hypothetical protein
MKVSGKGSCISLKPVQATLFIVVPGEACSYPDCTLVIFIEGPYFMVTQTFRVCRTMVESFEGACSRIHEIQSPIRSNPDILLMIDQDIADGIIAQAIRVIGIMAVMGESICGGIKLV